jgi:gamma-glutamyltranspeptidase/glutathione hydrolase
LLDPRAQASETPVQRRHAPLALLALVLAAAAARADGGAVATEHRAAADAGAAMLAAGGSATDAAVAAASTVCVASPSSCGVGGGGFALIWHAGRAYALDFREVAPAATRPALYLENGTPQPARSRQGGLAVGVPGEIAGWLALHERFGRLPLATVLAPAIRLARDGYPLAESPNLARQIERNVALLRADPGLAGIFLDDGAVPGPGFRIRQADLAVLLDAVARERRAAFYGGRVTDAIVAAVEARRGILTTSDLARYAPVWREPLSGTFAGRNVITFPPPGSGGVVLTVLGILNGTGARTREANPPLLAGALAQGFADRARWYGDPAYTAVPLATLLAPRRLASLRAELLAGTAESPAAPGVRDAGTAHVSVLAADGGAVALTTTINTAFGAGILVPGTGVILNNELDDFVLAPGAANIYGLSGGAPNLIGPGKRPQSSMSPTIVVRGGKPELVVGASGGPFIISATIQVLLDVLGGGRSVRQAVDAPRLHDQGSGTPVLVEAGVSPDVRATLGRGGRKVVEFPEMGAAAAVSRDAAGHLAAAGDPRKDGGAVVIP